MQRLHKLDYLRGLAAFGIMIYHYLSWTGTKYMASDFLGRIGIYGVSIFYVLSGLTLYHVYYQAMQPTATQILIFAKKRFLRIFPLLWLATILTIIISRTIPSYSTLFLNFSGLFGFIAWDRYISTGAWSIGNELVFYVAFPLFIYLNKMNKISMVLLAILVIGATFYFAFIVLKDNISLANQWKNYVNPVNQVVLFLSGFYIGHLFQNIKINNWNYVIALCLGLGLFILYPINGDPIQLVIGVNRLIFILISLIICLAFYKLKFNVPIYLHTPFKLLGEMSYSVYLLHPLVYAAIFMIGIRLERYGFHIALELKIFICLILTLITSFITHNYFEFFFINLGKKKNDFKNK